MTRRSSGLLMAVAASALALTAVPAAAQEWTAARPLAFAEQAVERGTLVLPLSSAADLVQRGGALDSASRAAVERALSSSDFRFGVGQTLSLRGIGAYDQILVVGAPAEAGNVQALQSMGINLGRVLRREAAPVSIVVEGLSAEDVSQLGVGLGYGGYGFDRHRSNAPAAPTGALTLVASDAAAIDDVWTSRGVGVERGIAFARDLSNEPPNVIYPEAFVSWTRDAFADVPNVTIEVLDVADMERLGMGAILGVGQGSERPPRMMIVRYRAPGSPDQPIVLVGKGITFDTGGISIKPSAGMGAMKTDMSGAASVTGTVLALALSRAPTHVVAVSALAENMPDGGAIRPSDILTAMDGTTIEVVSTDAEGRLVLADAIAYAEANLDPAVIVDVATLTGAVGGALGSDYAGLFANNDALADQLTAAGAMVGEELWRLPLRDSYAAAMASPVADMVNSGGGPGAGTGAWFISVFVQPGTPWAHLDIAAVARDATGSTGYGVRMLEQFVRGYQPVR